MLLGQVFWHGAEAFGVGGDDDADSHIINVPAVLRHGFFAGPGDVGGREGKEGAWLAAVYIWRSGNEDSIALAIALVAVIFAWSILIGGWNFGYVAG